jgi:hypothetical protein
MKAILEFILPEEQIEFNRANQSLDMACALFDILQLRKSLERIFENSHNTNNDVFDGIDAYAKRINEILDQHNINIDKLIE